MFTFGLKGGYDAGVKLVSSVKLFSHLANLGDTRSLIIHPASTTHSQLSEAELVEAGAGPDVVRVSVGIEPVSYTHLVPVSELWRELKGTAAGYGSLPRGRLRSNKRLVKTAAAF